MLVRCCRRAVDLVAPGEITFRDHEVVGHADLLPACRCWVKVLAAIFGVDHRDDALSAKASASSGWPVSGAMQGRRLGEARGFDQNAPEIGDLAREPGPVQVAQGLDDVLPDRAAQTPVRQQT